MTVKAAKRPLRQLARLLFPRLLSAAAAVGLLLAPAARGDEPLTYEKHIRPIFRAHCFDCHGAAKELKGGLDLRLVRLMSEGGDSGPAIVPGSPQESYLLERLRSGEMPPGEKSVPDAEIAVIQNWIASGAATARPEPAEIGPGLGITPEERSFWSFQPIRRPRIPPLDSLPAAARVRSEIDSLVVGHSLLDGVADGERPPGEASPLGPEADRRTLVMRSHLVLTGLPPAPEQLERWLAEPAPDWFDRLLAELLNSPHYGERWARHWLDVAGYSDSEGYSVADAERPWAWKYRDWVIRALNDDVPFDRFVTEQLAGDELAGPRQGDLTAEQIRLLTATGFLRMAADGTGSGANDAEARNQTVADTLKIVGTSLLGLSLQCAQCHDHRYDPILQTDYYALRAVFEPALDWQAWKAPAQRQVSLYTAADRQRAAEVEAEAEKIAAEKSARQSEYMRQALDQELEKYEEPLRGELREAYETAAGKRTDEQKLLLKKHPSVNITPGNLYQYIPDSRPKLAEFDKRIAAVRKQKPPQEFLRALVEPPNHAPPTKLFHRGDHRQPQQAVAPAPLSVLEPEGSTAKFPADDPSLPTTGRRLALARWLTGRDNPLLARVIVNRVWMHHFGTGLVATPADFGRLGAEPSHPQLLDWLADEFIAGGWSLKKLHRRIMQSATWRQASGPQSRFRQSLLRLEAEAIRDRMLAASGQLDRSLFGPPLAIKEDETGQVVVDGPQTRRSLYIQVRRSRPVAMLQTFDAPVMETNCESRANSTVATQSLMLLNGEFVLQQAALLADRAAAEAETVAPQRLAALPAIPAAEDRHWQYGFGAFDAEAGRTGQFQPLPHWTGSQWQGGARLPDPQVGWVLLNANGGHPDAAGRAVIRRWTAPADGTVTLGGKLAHGSANGDGVRGRVVSSRSGLAGEWTAHNGAADTPVPAIEVRRGDTVDFVTDCRGGQTSDSFSWPVTVTLKSAGQPDRQFASADQFRGPAESAEAVPGQIVRAWQLAYGRQPTDEELSLAAEFVARQVETMRGSPAATPKGRSAYRQAVTNLCQSLLGSNEFLYVE